MGSCLSLFNEGQRGDGGGGEGRGGGRAEDVLFFPDKAGMPCRFYGTPSGCRRGQRCTYAHEVTSLVKFLRYLGSTRRTVDVCVFNLTCNEIADTLLDLKNRGVALRIITDKEQASSNGSDIGRLQKAGIPVRTQRGEGLMHHKFAVLDGGRVMSGSFNWTRSAVLANHENVIVTTERLVVTRFATEYQRLWNDSVP